MSDDPGGWSDREDFLEKFYPETVLVPRAHYDALMEDHDRFKAILKKARDLLDKANTYTELACGDCVRGLDATLRAAGLADGDEPQILTAGSAAIARERIRQVEKEGFHPENDDDYVLGEMLLAAASYLLSEGTEKPLFWPSRWDHKWWKPTGKRRNLVKAGALIAAEIDRIDRAALRAVGVTDA